CIWSSVVRAWAWRSVDALAGATGDAEASALADLDPDPGRLAVLGVERHHVGDVDRPLALDHAGRRVRPAGARALVALDHVKALDVSPLLRRLDAQHLSGLAAVLAGDHHHLVVSADASWHG